jgi:hypothetical protein
VATNVFACGGLGPPFRIPATGEIGDGRPSLDMALAEPAEYGLLEDVRRRLEK